MLRQSQRQRDREWERCRCHPLIQPRRRPTLHVLLLPAVRVSNTLRPVSPKHLLDLERERAKKASRRAKCVAPTAGRKSAVGRSVSANINFGTRIVLLGNTTNVESNGMLQRRKARKKREKGAAGLGPQPRGHGSLCPCRYLKLKNQLALMPWKEESKNATKCNTEVDGCERKRGCGKKNIHTHTKHLDLPRKAATFFFFWSLQAVPLPLASRGFRP